MAQRFTYAQTARTSGSAEKKNANRKEEAMRGKCKVNGCAEEKSEEKITHRNIGSKTATAYTVGLFSPIDLSSLSRGPVFIFLHIDLVSKVLLLPPPLSSTPPQPLPAVVLSVFSSFSSDFHFVW